MTIQTVLDCLNNDAFRAVVHREMERAAQNQEFRSQPYWAVREALMTSLNLTLARMLGPPDRRNATLSQLFVLLGGLDLAGWERDRLDALERATASFARLRVKVDSRTRRLLERRNKLLSHSDITKKPQEKPTRDDARTLLADVLNLVNDLNLAINGEALEFDEFVTHWQWKAAAFWGHFMS